MRKEITYLALFLALFTSCEEYYKPDLEVVASTLVVESRISNNLEQSFVKLSMTKDFYNTTASQDVVGAKVELVQVGGSILKGIDGGTGYFTFTSSPVPGKKYFLRITNQKDIYQSETVLMPPIPQIDSLYTIHNVEKSYRTDAFGNPGLVETPGRKIYIDAPITSSLEYYRFDWRAVLQWVYTPPAPAVGPPPPAWYGWKSIYDLGTFNLAGPKEFSSSDKVTKHSIVSLAYNTQAYLDSISQVGFGWILILDEYGTTKSSYDFHEKLNKQLSAEGSLFDPVLTQVYGNIKCTSDPTKTILGFFELNSYRQYRYFLNLGVDEGSQAVQRRLNRYPDISYEGHLIGERPSFWESN
ncbi:hypothetical protein AQPE_2937 [Aquipluma nitroreducens]|uniref:DUF4249 domain-containing protein n=1 Tax=Aquipluma nitroreducens TaxID=2010828 RepID=A0A5K7SB32_9BACT|nr:DUF4249 family protein [Aquipluma nitroreducens]BBE18772.1 hypothetical protein AQPE_2937 [Aquipluma nitroreducens]